MGGWVARGWAVWALLALLTGQAPAWATKVLAASPGSLSFGDQPVGTQSGSQTVTLTNTGDEAVAVNPPLPLGGNGRLDFLASQNCSQLPLAPGESCQVYMTFAPQAAGPRSTTLVIPSDAEGSPLMVALSGNGVAPAAPAIRVSPTNLTFGSQPVGTASGPQGVTVTNTGTAPLVISGISVTPGGEFATAGGGGSIAPGGSQTITVTFTPAAPGPRSATLSIGSNVPGGTTVPLAGTGAPAAVPAVGLSPTSLDFGDQLVSSSAKLSVTLTNTGNGTLHISSVGLGGADAGDFAIAAGGTVGSVGAGSSHTIKITFTPGSAGSRGSVLSIVDDAPGSPHTVSLMGNGVQPGITVTPGALEFGSQPVGARSAAQSVTITNTGTAPLTIGRVTISPSSDFAASGGGTIGPGGSQSLSVTFAPTTAGERSATLSVTSNAPGAAPNVALHGTGAAPPPPPGMPALSLTPGSLTYNSQSVGTASGVQRVLIGSIGTAPLTISSIRLGGANPNDFTIIDGGETGTLAEGLRQTVSLRFTPTAAGSRSALLIVTSNAPGSPHSAPLSGPGVAIVAPPLPAGDWPQLGHDARQLGLADSALDPRGLLPWSVPLGAPAGGSPVAQGGVIYAGTEAGVVAVDAATHAVRWTRALPAPVRSTPSVAAGVLVVSAGGLFGLNPADGSVRWQRADLVASSAVSPLLAGDGVYLSVSRGGRASTVAAVSPATGADLWAQPAPLPAGFDDRAAAAASPELGLLFVALAPATGSRASAGPGAVVALRLVDGQAAWTAPIFVAGAAPTALSVGWVDSTPALLAPQPAVFLATGQSVTALHAESGALLWSRTLPEAGLIGPPVLSTAAARGSTLFVSGASGRVHALDSTTGSDRPGSLATGMASIVGPAALAGTVLFVPTGSGLVALDTTTGASIWSSPVVASGVAVASGMALLTTADGRLAGFSR